MLHYLQLEGFQAYRNQSLASITARNLGTELTERFGLEKLLKPC